MSLSESALVIAREIYAADDCVETKVYAGTEGQPDYRLTEDQWHSATVHPTLTYKTVHTYYPDMPPPRQKNCEEVVE